MRPAVVPRTSEMRITRHVVRLALAALILPGCKHASPVPARETRAADRPAAAEHASAAGCGDDIVVTVRPAPTGRGGIESQLVMPVERLLRRVPRVARVETATGASFVQFVAHVRPLDRNRADALLRDVISAGRSGDHASGAGALSGRIYRMLAGRDRRKVMSKLPASGPITPASVKGPTMIRLVEALERLDRRELRGRIERAVAHAHLPALGGQDPQILVRSSRRRLILLAARGASPARVAAWMSQLRVAVAQVAGVTDVEPIAPIEPQLRVIVDPHKLRSLGISAAEVAQSLSRALATHSASRASLARLGDTPLRIGHPQRLRVRLRDVADLERGFASSPAAWLKGDRAALLRVEVAAKQLAGLKRAVKKETSPGIKVAISGPLTVSRCGDSGIPRVSGPIALVRVTGNDTDVQHVEKAIREDAILVRGASVLGGQPPDAAPQLEIVRFDTDQSRAAAQARTWLRALASMPGLAAHAAAPTPDALRLVVTFEDAGQRQHVVKAVRTELRHAPASISIGPTPRATPTLAVKVDRAAAARLGVSPADIARAARFALSPQQVGDLHLAAGPVSVVMEIGPQGGSPASRLRGISVRSATGARVSLTQVAQIASPLQAPVARRLDGRPFVAFELSPAGPASKALRAWIQNSLIPRLRAQVHGLDAHLEKTR